MKASNGPIGNIHNPKKPINIIGGGFSGLVMAYYLKKSGFQVTLFERESAGGKLQTIKTDDGLVEYAANAIYSNHDVDELISDLNLNPLFAKPKLKKWVWRNQPSKPVTLFQIIKIIPKLFRRIPDRNFRKISVYDFFKPLMGHELAYDLLSAVFGGVYAIDSKKLSFISVFKHPIKAKTYLQFFKEVRQAKAKNYKPCSISFQGGMSELCQALRNEISGSIQKSQVDRIDDIDNWIICTDAKSASDILDGEVASILRSIEYTPLTTTTLFTKRRVDFLKNSFGLVIPPKYNLKTKGVLANHEIFERPAVSSHSYTFIAEGLNDVDQSFFNEVEELTSIKHKEVLNTFSMKWKRAIPVYDIKREESILKLRKELLDSQNLVLFGNYIDGISLREIVSMAKSFARRLK